MRGGLVSIDVLYVPSIDKAHLYRYCRDLAEIAVTRGLHAEDGLLRSCSSTWPDVHLPERFSPFACGWTPPCGEPLGRRVR